MLQPADFLVLAWIKVQCEEMPPKQRIAAIRRVRSILERWARGPVSIRSPEDVAQAAAAAEAFQREIGRLLS